MPQVGLKRSAIYDKIKNGEFPKPISLGPRAVAWIADEIDQWVDARIEASRNAVGGR
jgi:prophage regulatory protein